MAWTRIADYSQRTVSILLFGLTIYGLSIMVRGGHGVLKRRKERQLLNSEQQQESGGSSENS